MIVMNTGSHDGVGKHPFQNIDDELQIIVAAWRSERGFSGQLEREALATICKRMEALAAIIFSKWHFRNSEDDARDVVQEWVVRMWNNGLKRYDSDRPMCIYAYTVFLRICYSRGRQEGRRMTHLEVEPADESTGSHETAIADEVRNDIDEAMRSLRPKCRDAVRRIYWGDETREDTSEPDSTMRKKVYGRAARGRARLRRLLAKHAEGMAKRRLAS